MLKKGELVIVKAGEQIPADGEVMRGRPPWMKAPSPANPHLLCGRAAEIFCSVTGGTTLVSDWLKIRITSEPGNSFLDRMIALVEGASRKKTPQ